MRDLLGTRAQRRVPLLKCKDSTGFSSPPSSRVCECVSVCECESVCVSVCVCKCVCLSV